jgi:hypothetical protein
VLPLIGNFSDSCFWVSSWPLCQPRHLFKLSAMSSFWHIYNLFYYHSFSAGWHFRPASIMLCIFIVLHPMLLFPICVFLFASRCDSTSCIFFGETHSPKPPPNEHSGLCYNHLLRCNIFPTTIMLFLFSRHYIHRCNKLKGLVSFSLRRSVRIKS